MIRRMTINSAGLAVQLDIDTDKMYVCSFSPDRSRILTGAHDVPIQLWNTQTGGHVRTFEGHADMVWALTWERDQQQFMSGAFDRHIRVWDAHSGRCIRILKGTTVTSGAFRQRSIGSERCRAQATARSVCGTSRMADALECSKGTRMRSTMCRSVLMSGGRCRHPETERSASGMSKQAAACTYWKAIATRGRRSCGAKTDDARYQRRGRRSGCGPLTMVNVCAYFKGIQDDSQRFMEPDQQHAASASYDRTVRVWNIDSGDCLEVLEGHQVGVVNAVWSSDSRHLHSCDCEGRRSGLGRGCSMRCPWA